MVFIVVCFFILMIEVYLSSSKSQRHATTSKDLQVDISSKIYTLVGVIELRRIVEI
jgi:hypothetical protein